jgi:hypothetical protein
VYKGYNIKMPVVKKEVIKVVVAEEVKAVEKVNVVK